MDVVVVESPTKAKSIAKYLGEGYKVLPSYGHVRDLPEKDGSVKPEKDFEIVYEPLPEKQKRVEEIARAVKGARRLWLATDPDREGEAISWHLKSLLDERGATAGVDVKRVAFHEITKPAVLEAMRRPRGLDYNLVDAYQARRALDYLVGFTLSPVLWRKLHGARSAGRVQSVALRLICEREAEIEAFVAREYWTVEALVRTPRGERFTARLVALDGKKLGKFDLSDRRAAEAAVAAIRARPLLVASVERKQVARVPPPPFSTATLQQEAARKLGFSADRTMRVAQRLFEGVDLDGETVGLITYMRTDSVALSSEALEAARAVIGERFGARYLPPRPRQYKTKAKNAQEAHEAIRPTDLARSPDKVAPFLDDDQRRLYELVWRRTIASQMASALLDRVVAEIASPDGAVGLRATGQTIAFDGFLKVYEEGRDDRPSEEDEEETGKILPPLAPGDKLEQEKLDPTQHFTEPPPRYTEASLVKKLEELGIGRPSTYATIISVLKEREYVRVEKGRFVPTDRGRLVNGFLVSFFDRWVQPGFTAELEAKLDEIAAGEVDWRSVLRAFWEPFQGSVREVEKRRLSEVIEALNQALAPKLFPPRADGSDPRACPLCGTGRLSLKLGRFGAFVGCSNYPECRYTRKLGGEEQDKETKVERPLGTDPASGEEVWLRDGRFGPYVQRGDGESAKRCSLPPGTDPASLDLARALALLALPRELGRDPSTGEPVLAGIGRFGPYVQRGRRFVTLPPGEDVLEIGINRAIALLAESERGGGRRAAGALLRELGTHPADGAPVTLHAGRFGPYVKHGALNASLPKGTDPESLTLEEALALLEAKAARGGSVRGAEATEPRARRASRAPARAEPEPAAPARTSARAAARTDERPAASKPATTAAAPRASGARSRRRG
ncbi:MAG: type I DNA topoisomerase [Geminicoccaceae bacterium]|nr:type I DNA topoisomerase [Geminicoccaceae bacterium]